MKVYLDDLREAPDGWTRAHTAEQVIDLLRSKEVSVEALSLDNDLGDGQPEGFTVLDWLEEAVYNDNTFPVPEITIHSCNPVRIKYMQLAVASIVSIRAKQEEGLL
jgi:hypothetical protein